MEETEDKVGALYFLDILHPFLSAADHLFKLDALPDVLCEPVGDGRGEHADDGNLDAIDVVDRVRLEARVDVFGVGRPVGAGMDDVGAQQWTAHLTDPLVVNLMARLDIVVAYGLCIVLHIVDDPGSEVLVLRHHVVGPINAGLALKDVAIVDEQQILGAELIAFLIYISISAYKGAF